MDNLEELDPVNSGRRIPSVANALPSAPPVPTAPSQQVNPTVLRQTGGSRPAAPAAATPPTTAPASRTAPAAAPQPSAQQEEPLPPEPPPVQQPDPARQEFFRRAVRVSQDAIERGDDISELIERNRSAGRWTDQQEEDFLLAFDSVATMKEDYESAVDLIKNEGDPVEFLAGKSMRSMWDEQRQERFLRLIDRIGEDEDLLKSMRTQQDVEATAEKLKKIPPVLREVLSGIGGAGISLMSLGARPFSGETANDLLRRGQIIGAATDEANTLMPSLLSQTITGTAQSIATAAVGSRLGGQVGTISLFATTALNQALYEAEESGLSGTEKWRYAGGAGLIEGLVTTAFSRLGAGGFERLFSGGGATKAGLVNALKSAGMSFAEELPEELIIEVLNLGNNAAIGGEVSWDAFKDVAIPTIAQTALSVGVMSGSSSAMRQTALKERDAFARGLSEQYKIEQGDALRAIQAAEEASRKSGKNDTFQTVLGKELQSAVYKTPEGAATWAADNPIDAASISVMKEPSRRAFETLGLPPMSKEERSAFARNVRDTQDIWGSAQAEQPVAEAEAVEEAEAEVEPVEQVEQVDTPPPDVAPPEEAAAPDEAEQRRLELVQQLRERLGLTPPQTITEPTTEPTQEQTNEQDVQQETEQAGVQMEGESREVRVDAEAEARPEGEGERGRGVRGEAVAEAESVTPAAPPATSTTPADLAALSWPELRAVAKELGVKVKGKRAELEAAVREARSVSPTAEIETQADLSRTDETQPEATGTPADQFASRVDQFFEDNKDLTPKQWDAKIKDYQQQLRDVVNSNTKGPERVDRISELKELIELSEGGLMRSAKRKGRRVPVQPESETSQAQSLEKIPGTKAVAQRSANAEGRFIDLAMETAGLTREQAETALARYKKDGAIKIDKVTGQFTFTNGGFAEADVMRRAAGVEETTGTPADPATPTEAAAEVRAEMSPASDNRRPASEIRKEIVQRLEQAIKDVDAEGAPDTVTFTIPGNGTFTIKNTAGALGALLKKTRAMKIGAEQGPQAARGQVMKVDRKGNVTPATGVTLNATIADLVKSMQDNPQFVAQFERQLEAGAYDGDAVAEKRVRSALEKVKGEQAKGAAKEAKPASAKSKGVKRDDTPKKRKIDLILDEVERSGEVSMAMEGEVTSDLVKRVEAAAKARGMIAAYDGSGFLIRKDPNLAPVATPATPAPKKRGKKGAVLKIERNGDKFEAFVDGEKVGQGFISKGVDNRWRLYAIDVDEQFRRKGYATQIVREMGAYIKRAGGVALTSSNKGSGTVQILDRIFGRENVTHKIGGEVLSFNEVVKHMDVDFGYSRSEVNLENWNPTSVSPKKRGKKAKPAAKPAPAAPEATAPRVQSPTANLDAQYAAAPSRDAAADIADEAARNDPSLPPQPVQTPAIKFLEEIQNHEKRSNAPYKPFEGSDDAIKSAKDLGYVTGRTQFKMTPAGRSALRDYNDALRYHDNAFASLADRMIDRAVEVWDIANNPNSAAAKEARVKSPTANLTAAERARADELKAKIGDAITKSTAKFAVDPGGPTIFDGQTIAMAAELATIYIKGGARTFAQFAATMKQDAGDVYEAMERYLHSVWTVARVDDPTLPPMTPEQADAVLKDLKDGKSVEDIEAAMQEDAGGETIITDLERIPPERQSAAFDSDVYTGVTHAYTDEQRERLNMPKRSITERKAVERLQEQMEEAYAANPDVGRNLIERFKADPTMIPRDYELMVLERETVLAEQEMAAAAEAQRRMYDNVQFDDVSVDQLEDRMVAANTRLDDIYKVLERAGTAAGRALQARQNIMNSEFNIQRMRFEMQREQKGKKLTKAQEAEIERLKADRDSAYEQLRQVEADRERVRQDAENMVAEERSQRIWAEEYLSEALQKDVRPSVRKAMLSAADRLEASAKAGFASMRGKTFDVLGATAEGLAYAAQYGAAQILRGTVKVADWTVAMRKQFSGITDDDLRKVRKESDAIAKEELRNLHVKEEDAKVKRETQKAKKSGRKRTAADADIEADPDADLAKQIRAMFRAEVDTGTTEFADALSNVTELAQELEPGIDSDRVRDLFSGYGRARPQDRTLNDKIISQMRREAQLLASIQRVHNQLAPLKSGPQREKPTQRIRELEKELKNLMKEAGITTRDSEQALATALDAAKTRTKNQIEDFEKAITSRTKMVRASNKPIEGDLELKQLRDRRDQLREVYNEMFPQDRVGSRQLTPEQRIANAERIAERTLEKLQAELEEAKYGRFTDKTKPDAPKSELLMALRDQIDQTKQDIMFMRELSNPGVLAVRAKQKRLEYAIRRMKKQMESGDYRTNRTVYSVDMSFDAESMQALQRYDNIRKQWRMAKEHARWDSMNIGQRSLEMFAESYNLVRNLAYSADVSFAGRQGWFYLMSHPIQWGRAAARSILAIDPKKSAKYYQELKESNLMMTNIMKVAKVNIAEGDGTGNFDSSDDYKRLDFARRIPGLGRFIIDPSGRSFATSSNEMRSGFMRILLQNTKTGRNILKKNGLQLSEAEKEHLVALGKGVNILTGSGTLKHRGLEILFGAPKFVVATFQTLLGAPVISNLNKPEVALSFGKEYARVYGALAAIYAVAGLIGDDDDEIETDPTSSSFGEIQITDEISWNPIGVLRPQINILAKVLFGYKKTNSGYVKLKNSLNPWQPEGVSDMDAQGGALVQELLRYGRTKFHPGINASLGMITGEDFIGNEQSRARLAWESLSPITPRIGIEAPNYVSPANAALMFAMESLGFSSGFDYDTREYIEFRANDEATFRNEISKRVLNGARPTSDERERVQALKAMEGFSKEEVIELAKEKLRADNPDKTDVELFGRGNDSWQRRQRNIIELYDTQDPTAPIGLHIMRGFRPDATVIQRKAAEAYLQGYTFEEADQALIDFERRRGRTANRNKNWRDTEYGKVRLEMYRYFNESAQNTAP